MAQSTKSGWPGRAFGAALTTLSMTACVPDAGSFGPLDSTTGSSHGGRFGEGTDVDRTADAETRAGGRQTSGGAGLAGDDRDLDSLDGGAARSCAESDLLGPEVYVGRIKSRLTGLPATSRELEQVENEGKAGLQALIRDWIDTPAYAARMRNLLTELMHQASGGGLQFASQATGRDQNNFGGIDGFFENLNESMARTALWIVEQDRPFTEIASTTTWMMTSGMMSYLAMSEGPEQVTVRFYHNAFSENGQNFDANTPWSVQVEHQTFYNSVPIAGEDCSDPHEENRVPQLFRIFSTGTASQGVCGGSLRAAGWQGSDVSDWRPVRFVPVSNQNPAVVFNDMPRIRNLSTWPVRTMRAGYFSQPEFLASWRSNEDNSFRVTTNQTLIVGLGHGFEDNDVSLPVSDEGLAAEHAGPETECYNCHKNLDPMRNFFYNVFDPDSYKPLPLEERTSLQPSFSFLGHQGTGSDLTDLGAMSPIATSKGSTSASERVMLALDVALAWPRVGGDLSALHPTRPL